MVAPIIAAKAAQGVGKALSGDIWSRTSIREVGRGRDKHLVESTIRLNTGAVLLGGAAVGLTALSLGTAAFMVGVKAKPAQRPVYYGDWYWPSDSSTAFSGIKEGSITRPSRILTISEAWDEEFEDVLEGGHLEPAVQIGWQCTGCDATLVSMTVTGLKLDFFFDTHADHRYGVVPLYAEQVWVPAVMGTITITHPAVTEVEVAIWIRNPALTQYTLGFDVAERPTLAEGLTGAISGLASIPLDIAFAPITAAQQAIQDFKESIGLP